MNGSRRLRISLLAVTSAALLGSGVTAASAAPAAQPAQDRPQAASEAPVERLIVGYEKKAAEAKSDAEAKEDARAKGRKAGESLSFERRLGTGAALVDLGDGLKGGSLQDVIDTFEADPDVAYVDRDTRMYATAAPNDTYYNRQWDFFEATAGMNVQNAWDGGATGRGVTVAVIDTGYVTHSDLGANIVSGYDFISDAANARDGGGRDSNPRDEGDWSAENECYSGSRASDSSWHGTHVAGTVAAVADNGKGVAGVAYNAKVQPVRVLGKCGGSTADIADAIVWASGGSVPGVPVNPSPADVINLSLGGSGSCQTITQNAINGAVGRGTTVVVAAGNSNTNASGFTPANCANVVNVAASDREGNRASYSNYGSIIDITAPGGETAVSSANGILSTLNSSATTPGTENYEAYQGTSMATPHIAGLAALMYEKDPAITPSRVESLIKNNARTLPGTCSGGCGYGLADAAGTLAAMGGGTTPEPDPTEQVFTNSENWSIPDGDGRYVYSNINVSGVSGYAPSDLKVSVDIKHTYRGDLRVQLVAPNGSIWTLKDTSAYDSADNVLATYTVNASSVLASGTWQLRVTDVYSGDTGYIDSWSLTF
ncbi:S8 family serine peptidase [Streptomyces toyocaensis]|uniref:S8 family peptidase n=1 Tax=Streptomyces toyocaensis TaxID=55952 RepID=UPI001F163140|nr:S8 family serine peptidase [Streptomyces toyocaensis]